MTEELSLHPEVDDQRLLTQVIEYYHRALKQSPDALDYLRRRGITNSEAIEHFRIGYADRTLGLKLPSKQLKAGKELRGRLERLGIYRESGHEHFNGCVVFPIHDGSGQVLDIYGRKIGQRLRKGTPLDMHLNEQRRGVWNIEAFAATDEIILCSSLFDALTFWNAGYRNVTCTFGTDALTDDHMSAFGRFGIRRVLTTSKSITSTLTEAGLDCSVLNMPTGMDVSEYDLHMDDPAESLGAATQIAEPAPTTNQTVLPAEPQQPTTVAEADLQRDEVRMMLGNRRYRIRGLARNLSFDLLRLNVLVTTDRGTHVDTFDLYSARHRQMFIAQAAAELEVEERTIKKDLGRVLLKLEELQDQQIKATLEPKSATPTMTREDKEAALELLSDPKLLDRIVNDFDVVGEENNKLLGYLAAVSRRLDDPLAIIVQSSSSAGKTSLMDAILSFVPPEDQVKYSAMSGQSLFYMGDRDLSHKVLAIVEEEGSTRATYALKLLQSEGELTIASTGKNTSTSRLVTQEYRVDGPVMIMLTTTAIKVDEELLNRCIVLTVNEDRDQTRAIHRLQRERETLRGQLADQDWQQTIALHWNAQRLLRPLVVANPHAEALTFLDHKIRARRDHVKYLTLIRTIALLHQYQRPIKTISHKGQQVEYIEVTLDDIDVANRLANEVLGHAVDDLPPQSRVLLDQIDKLVAAGCNRKGVDRCDYRFTRRDIREHAGCGHTQLGVHLQRLVELEYLLVHRGGRGQQFVYELLHRPPANGDRALAGLIDVDQLRRNLPGSNGNKPATYRPQSGAKSVGIRPHEINTTPCETTAETPLDVNLDGNAPIE